MSSRIYDLTDAAGAPWTVHVRWTEDTDDGDVGSMTFLDTNGSPVAAGPQTILPIVFNYVTAELADLPMVGERMAVPLMDGGAKPLPVRSVRPNWRDRSAVVHLEPVRAGARKSPATFR